MRADGSKKLQTNSCLNEKEKNSKCDRLIARMGKGCGICELCCLANTVHVKKEERD